MELFCQGMGEELCALVQPCLESAAKSLDLAADFLSFTIVIDDLPDASEPWLRLEKIHKPDRNFIKGTLFCSESFFCSSDHTSGTVFPPVEIWDQAPAPGGAAPFDLARFSSSRTENFLHHELLMARDLVRGEVVPGAIATGQVEAFSALWAICIDGRLSRMGLPGFSQAERRSRFSRLFACAGVLLPDHWQIFQSLWDGGVAQWKDVQASIRLLPRL